MSVFMIICIIGIVICTYALGYNYAMLKTAKAVRAALDNLPIASDELDFRRGALWVIGYIQDTLDPNR